MTSLEFLGHQRRVSISTCNYSVWSSGTGPLVVLLHGWPVTSRHWDYVVPLLSQAGYEVCSIDLKGLGESHSTCGSFAKENIAREILEVIEICYPGLTSMNVIGHDWGGSVAVAMAAVSKKVRRLVIEEEILPGIKVSLSELGSALYPTWHGGFHRAKPLAEDLIQQSQKEYFNFFLNLRHDPRTLSQGLRDHFLMAYDSAQRLPQFLEYYRTVKEDEKFFVELSNNKLVIPILGIGGKYAMGNGVLECLKAFTTHPKFFLFEKSGHYPAEEEAREFAERVTGFLDQNS